MREFRVQGSRILDIGPDSYQCWILDRILDRILDTGYWSLEIDYWILDIGFFCSV